MNFKGNDGCATILSQHQMFLLLKVCDFFVNHMITKAYTFIKNRRYRKAYYVCVSDPCFEIMGNITIVLLNESKK
jgi:hypothetical protein